MEIAIIGWGSLIWCPGCLRIKSRWYSDGPMLPIEFARISGDGRLTLVIHPGPQEQPTLDQHTYWALSGCTTLQEARENLGMRERAKKIDYIYGLNIDGEMEGEKEKVDPKISRVIGEWLKAKKGIQAALWTGLASNWEREQKGRKFSVKNAVQYLAGLERAKGEGKAAFDRAFEYVTNTPFQIQTPVRKIMREERGWKDAPLSSVLFEAEKGDKES
jgi:hypothetical protein